MVRVAFCALGTLALATAAISAPAQSPLIPPKTTGHRLRASQIYRGNDPVAILSDLATQLDKGIPERWDQLIQAPQTAGTSGIENMAPKDLVQVLTNWQIDDVIINDVAGDLQILLGLAVDKVEYVAQHFTYALPNCLSATADPPASAAEEGEDQGQNACLTTLFVVAKPKFVVVDQVWATELIHIFMKSEASVIQQSESYEFCFTCWLFFTCCEDRTRPRGLSLTELDQVEQLLSTNQASWTRTHIPSAVKELGFNAPPSTVSSSSSMDPHICNGPQSSLWPAPDIDDIDHLLRRFICNKWENRDVFRKHDSDILLAFQNGLRGRQQNIKKMLLSVQEQGVAPLLEAMVADCLHKAGVEEPVSDWFKRIYEKNRGETISLECAVSTQRKQVIQPPAKGCRVSTEVSSKTLYSWAVLSPRGTLIDSLIVQSTLDITHVECEPLHPGRPGRPGRSLLLSSYEEPTGAIVRWSLMHTDGSFHPVHYIKEWAKYSYLVNKAMLDIIRYAVASAYLRIGIPSSTEYSHQDTSLTTTTTEESAVKILDHAQDALLRLGWSFKLNVNVVAELILFLLRTSITEKVKHQVCLGFEKYDHMAKASYIGGVDPKNIVSAVKDIVKLAHLPDNEDLERILLAVKYSDTDFTWTGESITYTAPDGNAHHFYLTKHFNPETNKIDLVYGMLNGQFSVAQDMIIVKRKISILGGIFNSEKTTFDTIPHELTLNDTVLLEKFFETIVFRKIAIVTNQPPPEYPDLQPLCGGKE